jgi:hypothetical protein
MSLNAAMSEIEDSQRESSARLTADRTEIKYLLPASRSDDFILNITPLLSPHRYRETELEVEQAPCGEHYATTVYFDTAGRDLYRAAVSEPVHVKVRAREYYEVCADGSEVDDDAPAIRQFRPVIWIELKARDGQRSRKRRVCIPKLDFGYLLGERSSENGHSGQRTTSPDIEDIAAELERLRGRLREPLRASCVVNYRRLAWQGDGLRITLDRNVCAFAPPAELWMRHDVLTRQALGTPVFEEAHCVLEVKSRGQQPAWLSQVLDQHQATEAAEYSKFVMASRTVHEPR